MKLLPLLVLFNLIYNLSIAQIDTTNSTYGILTTKKFYKVNYSTLKVNDRVVYKINDIEVDKDEYEKYHNTWVNIETCKPCILEIYDINDKILYKGIKYTDCPVGFWIEYFPNGRVKLIGHYKENESGNWNDLTDKGLCKRDGIFTYFNENGEEIYVEYWKDGQFLRQIPEQQKTELWNIELTLNGLKVNKQVLNSKQVSEIKIIPQFKNNSTAGTNITIKFKISVVGHKPIEQTFTLSNFKKINVQKMFKKLGVKKSEVIQCLMLINNNGIFVSNFWINVRA